MTYRLRFLYIGVAIALFLINLNQLHIRAFPNPKLEIISEKAKYQHSKQIAPTTPFFSDINNQISEDNILSDFPTELFYILLGILISGVLSLSIRTFKFVRSAIRARMTRFYFRKERQRRTFALSQSNNIYNFLQDYYGVDLYSKHNTSYPAVVFPIPDENFIDRNSSILSPWNRNEAKFLRHEDDNFVIYDERYVKNRKKLGRLENRQTYCMKKIDFISSNTPLIKSGWIGTYEDCLATSDALEYEILCAFGKKSVPAQNVTDFARKNLPLRNKLVQYLESIKQNPILSGFGRSAAIAISTLTIAYRADISEYVTFFGPRSSETVVGKHQIHVAPSGMFQPSKDWLHPSDYQFKEEWNITHHIYRELAEELFNIDVEKTDGETAKRFYGILDVMDLVEMIEVRKTAQAFTTGIMINLLNLRPEICTLLIIEDPKWYKNHQTGAKGYRHFERSWEFASDEDLRNKQVYEAKNDQKNIFWHKPITRNGKLLPDIELIESLGDISATRFSVPGAITLWLGMEYFRKWLLEKS